MILADAEYVTDHTAAVGLIIVVGFILVVLWLAFGPRD